MKRFVNKFCLFLFFVLTVFFSYQKTSAQSVGGTTSGGAIYCATANSGFINLDFYTGTILRWESSTDGEITWIPILNSINQLSYSSLTQTTCFRAIVQANGFPADSSTVSCVEIYPPSIGGAVNGAGVFCISSGSGLGTLTLTGSVGDVLYWQYSTDGGGAWNTVANTSTTLNYSNIFQNRLYRAVVQNGSTCPSDTSTEASFTFDSVTVTGTIAGSDTVCPGINGNTLTLSGNVGSILTWLSSTNNGNTWTPISNTTTTQLYSNLFQTTWYEVIVKNGTCNSDSSNSAAITIVPNPVSAGSDTTITPGQSVELNGTGNGTPLWTPSSGLDSTNVFKPTASPANTTYYLLTVTDSHSCINKDSVLITVRSPEFGGIVSNLFTPNGDGINDTWFINDIQNYPDNEVFIYSIYGNLVYTKKGYVNDWPGTYNGSELPDGTYFYVLRFENPDLINKGSVDILRSK